MVVVVIVVVKFKQESELCFGCCSLALVFCLLLTWFGFSPSLVYFFLQLLVGRYEWQLDCKNLLRFFPEVPHGECSPGGVILE